MGVFFGDVAIVEKILIERHCVFGVNFGRDELSFLVVGVTYPAIFSVPVLGDRFAVIKLDQDVHGKNEVAFAMHDYHGAVRSLALLFIRGLLDVPVEAIGTCAENFVVQYLSSIDGLIV